MNIEKLQDYQCSGCCACANACPRNAITMRENMEGFIYPVIDHALCIECSACDRACTQVHEWLQEEDMLNRNSVPQAYAVINDNPLTRDKSSSGGVFRLLAEKVIHQGGIVYGASFNEKWEVCHGSVDNSVDLEKLQGSKYVQSRIGLVYRDIKKQLATGRLVLFSGTPCQCEGLYGYLGIKYDNLFVVDLICHGVPSPLVWKHYIQYVCKLKKSTEISRISFRSKKLSWERYLLEFTFVNSSKYQNDLHTDIYMRGFLRDLYLRKSCYQCSCRRLHRVSDITLADFWGIKNVLPSMYDGKGTSLVLVQSRKGEKMLSGIVAQKERVDFAQGIRGNPAYLVSPALNPKRDMFFQYLHDGKDFVLIMRKCLREPIYKRIRDRLRSVRILRTVYHCMRK